MLGSGPLHLCAVFSMTPCFRITFGRWLMRVATTKLITSIVNDGLVSSVWLLLNASMQPMRRCRYPDRSGEQS